MLTVSEIQLKLPVKHAFFLMQASMGYYIIKKYLHLICLFGT